jgi:hypothetical protein
VRFREYEPTIELAVTQKEPDAWLDGSFMVKCIMKGRRVEVRLRSGSVSIDASKKNSGPVWVRSVRAAFVRVLGTTDDVDNTTSRPGRLWEVLERSRKKRVRGKIDETTQLSLGGYKLSLNLPAEAELHDIWLVVQLAVERGDRSWWRPWRRWESQVSTIHACGPMGAPSLKNETPTKPEQDPLNAPAAGVSA